MILSELWYAAASMLLMFGLRQQLKELGGLEHCLGAEKTQSNDPYNNRNRSL
jgi:hypothetical protein